MRWYFAPAVYTWGRAYCKEFCAAGKVCQAESAATCSREAPKVLRSNRLTWDAFTHALQWANASFDIEFNGQQVQVYIGDRGVTGPLRALLMEKVGVCIDEYRSMRALAEKAKSTHKK